MPSKSPNIIYVVCHDLGKHLGCYGAMVESPTFDEFARNGIQFNNAFCNSPACSPSRGCAMTGRYAHNNGCIGLSHMGWPLPQSEETITEYLGEAGYQTIHSGLAHERLPETNHYEVELEDNWDDWDAHNAIGKAVDFLEKRDDERPFYLNIGTQQVHASTWHKVDSLHGGIVPPEDVWVPLYSHDNDVIRHQFGKFQASLRFLDQQFAKLLDALDRLNLRDDTIVIFTTDHGISNQRSKGTLYDRGVEIALLMQLPQKRMAGKQVDHLIQNIDVVPTLCEAAGRQIPEKVQGRSFWPLLNGGDYQAHDAVFIERNYHGERARRGDTGFIDCFDPVRSIRTRDFHYIRWFKPEIKCRPWIAPEVPADFSPELDNHETAMPEPELPRHTEELYHIRHDPLEFVNVVDRPEYRKVKEELNQRLEQWAEDTGDFAATDNPPPRPQEPGWGAWQA